MKPSRAGYVFSLQMALAIFAFVLTVLALYWVFLIAPNEAILGISQKIFYFHVSSAMNMMLLYALCGLLSIFYLALPNNKVASMVDMLALASAEVGAMFGAIVLTSGPLWAKKAWGTWWTWEPRLTLSLLVFFLFFAYLALRLFAGQERFGRSVASGLAVVGLPGLYFIHVAVERWGGAHPQVVFKGGLTHPEMRTAFFLSLLATGALAALLVALRFSLARLEKETDILYLELDSRFPSR